MSQTKRSEFENPVDVYIRQKREAEVKLEMSNQISALGIAVAKRQQLGHPYNHHWAINGIRTVKCEKCGDVSSKFAKLDDPSCIIGTFE